MTIIAMILLAASVWLGWLSLSDKLLIPVMAPALMALVLGVACYVTPRKSFPEEDDKVVNFVWHPKTGWQEHTKFAWFPLIRDPKRVKVSTFQLLTRDYGNQKGTVISYRVTPERIREMVADKPFDNPEVTIERWLSGLSADISSPLSDCSEDYDPQQIRGNGWCVTEMVNWQTLENQDGEPYKEKKSYRWENPPTNWQPA